MSVSHTFRKCLRTLRLFFFLILIMERNPPLVGPLEPVNPLVSIGPLGHVEPTSARVERTGGLAENVATTTSDGLISAPLFYNEGPAVLALPSATQTAGRSGALVPVLYVTEIESVPISEAYDFEFDPGPEVRSQVVFTPMGVLIDSKGRRSGSGHFVLE